MALQQPNSVNRLAEVMETMTAMKGEDYAARASLCAIYVVCLRDIRALMDIDYQSGRAMLTQFISVMGNSLPRLASVDDIDISSSVKAMKKDAVDTIINGHLR